MSSQPTDHSPASVPEPRGARSLLIVLSLAIALVFFAAAIPAPIRAAWSEFALTWDEYLLCAKSFATKISVGK